MKKVAATSGQSVRRMDFFLRAGTATGCGCVRVTLAVTNSYGCLPERLTLANLVSLVARPPVVRRFPGILAELVRNRRIRQDDCFVWKKIEEIAMQRRG